MPTSKKKTQLPVIFLCFLLSRSLRQLQSFSSIVCRTLAKMLCSLAFRLEATHFESPGPAPYSEDRSFQRLLRL
ncbi:hypothetical protein NXF25_006851 [Crotalus adamanteus]|uniref:Secreted protein n=1 Tax=Crotalus adamanteus TaxID=8729 RepID=A0AAW1C2I8_CROAD